LDDNTNGKLDPSEIQQTAYICNGGPPARCGDGHLDSGEQCDTSGESQTCNADCTRAACGDGKVNASAGEQCDVLGGADTATCVVSTCKVSVCGDGHLNAAAGERCDTVVESASCNSDCSIPMCGDGHLNAAAGEQCDDGNNVTEVSCPYGQTTCTGCSANCSTVLALTGPNCTDGMKNGAETGVDCGGGVCAACGVGSGCSANADCQTAACDALSLQCVSNACTDHKKDGAETDVDCGGGTCMACSVGKACASNFDCQAGHFCSTSRVCM